MRTEVLDPEHADAQAVLLRLSQALSHLVGNSGTQSFDDDDIRHPRAVFLVGYTGSTPIACGAIRPLSEQTAELKRMYAENGTGRALLQDLEARARHMGYLRIWLSTRVLNARAVAFYSKHGYRQIPGYGKYAGRDISICFGKELRQEP